VHSKSFFFFFFFPLWSITKGNDWANKFQKMKIAKENDLLFFGQTFKTKNLKKKKKKKPNQTKPNANPNFNTFENDRNIMESAKVYSVLLGT
jgi:hypothetical protein